MTISSVKTGEDSYDIGLSNPIGGIGRAVFMAGRTTSNVNTNVLDYVQIATTGNAIDFGDLNYSVHLFASCSSRTRGIAAGGSTSSNSNTIDYFTIASPGNATDFGDLATGYVGPTGSSNQTRGVFAGGYDGSVRANMTYITIASLGNSVSFGSLTAAKWQLASSANSTVGVAAGQNTTPTLERWVIATLGNAAAWGDLSVNRWNFSGGGNETRGLFAGGYNPSTGNGCNIIDYVTYSSSGGATDFGDLNNTKSLGTGIAPSQTRAVISIGNEYTSGVGNTAWTNQIDYVTIASAGNATDFGDLTVGRGEMRAVSDVHGGLFEGTISATESTTPVYEHSQGVAYAAGGQASKDTIDYVNIATLGNAADFGNLVSRKLQAGCVASSTRGVVSGKDVNDANTIDYFTIATTGNAADFGDLSVSRNYLGGSCNNTRGLFAGGYTGSGYSNVIDYITIASTGNATDFGDLVYARNQFGGAASTTRALHAGANGYPTGNDTTRNIDYVTIATTGNATTFGQLLTGSDNSSGMSSHIRALFVENRNSATEDIQYVTIATTGDAVSFGELTQTSGSNYNPAAASSKIRGLIMGGFNSNVIQYVTIASTGNSTDFGDLFEARGQMSGSSTSHGGI